MEDKTENIRRVMTTVINTDAQLQPTDDKEDHRKRLVKEYGEDNVWDTNQLSEHFEVLGFMAPFCVVKRKKDGQKGSVMFQHSPRLYFCFKPV